MKKHIIDGATMGSRYGVVIHSNALPDGLADKIHNRITEIDMMMTTYHSSSELMRLNATTVLEWMEISPDMEIVLKASAVIETQSYGAFNIAVGSLVAAWGFGASPCPSEEQIVYGLQNAPHLSLPCFEVYDKRARRLRDEQLDLSGIAKGYGVDAIVDILLAHDIQNALISIDGEIYALGKNHGNSPWPIAIENPDDTHRDLHSVVELENLAIATSGDYRHFVDTPQGRMSHSFNPRLGGPVQNNIASVSVIAPNAMTADAWATALLVLGFDAARDLCNQIGLSALFFLRENNIIIEKCVGGYFE